MTTAERAREEREGSDQPREVLVRLEVPDVEDVGRRDGVARRQRRARRRRRELGAQGHGDHAHLRRADAEPRHDRPLGVFRVRHDRGGAAGVQARHRGHGRVIDGSALPGIADEEQVVDRQHDGARRAQRALVVGREEHRGGVPDEGARQAHLIPPLGPRRVEHAPVDPWQRRLEARAGVAVRDARPAVERRGAQHLEQVAADARAHTGPELARVDGEPRRRHRGLSRRHDPLPGARRTRARRRRRAPSG